MKTLIDLIFKGKFSKIDLEFIKEFSLKNREMYFIYPEKILMKNIDEIFGKFKADTYVDFSMSLYYISFNEAKVPDIFVNIGRDDDEFELALFFDLKDLNKDFSEGLDYLHNWSIFFKNKFNFDSYFCQADGENYENEYYFKGGEI